MLVLVDSLPAESVCVTVRFNVFDLDIESSSSVIVAVSVPEGVSVDEGETSSEGVRVPRDRLELGDIVKLGELEIVLERIQGENE